MRRVEEVESKINYSKFLDYLLETLEDFWKIGDWYNLLFHPIEKIISKHLNLAKKKVN